MTERISTGRQRLRDIFEGRIPSRCGVKLWGLTPDQPMLHPAYAPVYELAMQQTDLVPMAGADFQLYAGRHAGRHFSAKNLEPDDTGWYDHVLTIQTPRGPLRQIERCSRYSNPPYTAEYSLKEPEDIEALLALPYEPFAWNDASFWAMEKRVGDAGLTLFFLEHPMYALQRLCGSINFAMWWIEAPELMLRAIQTFAERVRAHIAAALQAGVRYFGWFGPEVCAPPLMSFEAFDRFVGDLDRPLIELIHQSGGRMWVHCHGKMTQMLHRFVEMGVDVLNPIEPPPMGDITLPEAFERVGDSMALEGNIQIHDLMTLEVEQIRQQVRQAVSDGRGQRFILCPCSGYMEDPQPTARYIENLMAFIEEGVR